jgi:hypothetical protein
MSPEEIRQHAARLILDHARDIESLSIAESLEGVLDDDAPDAFGAVCEQIDELISKATITVQFPDWPGLSIEQRPVTDVAVAEGGCDECSVEPGEAHRYAGCPGVAYDATDGELSGMVPPRLSGGDR